jgi:hypothetical protein
MRIVAWVLFIVATVSPSRLEQTHPDFTGTWAVVPSRSIWQDGNGMPVNVTVFGERFTAEQSERVLAVAIENEKGFKWIYGLNGTVSMNAPPGPEGPQQLSCTTAWTDSEPIITTAGMVSRDGTPQRFETRRILKFNNDGTLRVEAPWGLNGAMIGSVYSRVR